MASLYDEDRPVSMLEFHFAEVRSPPTCAAD
jgi:hypothetical protein